MASRARTVEVTFELDEVKEVGVVASGLLFAQTKHPRAAPHVAPIVWVCGDTVEHMPNKVLPLAGFIEEVHVADR